MHSYYLNKLTSPSNIFSLLSQYHLSPKKKLGQNFLIDQNIVKIIVHALNLNSQESVFEIGTGLGALTESLSNSAKYVFTIEKDQQLKPVLEDLFRDKKRQISILYNDILNFDLKKFLTEKKEKGIVVNKIAGNLPYNISLPLLRKLMDLHYLLEIAVVMVQKEVAERMMAKPGNKNYGFLSVISQNYSHIDKIHLVKPNVFYPKPEVDSMIVRINFYDKPVVFIEDKNIFLELLSAIFQNRRKNINNSLKTYFGERIEQKELEKMLYCLGIDKNERGENFDLPTYASLTKEIKNIIK